MDSSQIEHSADQKNQQTSSSPQTLTPTSNAQLIKRPRRIWQRVVAVLIVAVAVFLGLASYHVVSSGNAILSGLNNSSFFGELASFIQSGDKKLVGEKEDRVNILLVGIGGEGHEGGQLADTLIIANIKPSTNEVALLSIPRDLIVNIPGYGDRKINNANAFGEQDNLPGGGAAFTARILSSTLNISIPYYVRIDFSGFKQIVDDVGGVEIDVERAFTDSQYPTLNYGFQTLVFKKGVQRMDGERALKYVRSRHGNNGEGSDFARSRRQQKVLLALKDKILSLQLLTNPEATSKVADDLGKHIATNLKLWEILRLRSYATKIGNGEVTAKVLENTEGGMLKAAEGLDGAYILVPRSKDFSEIQTFIDHIFEYAPINSEKARVDLFAPFSSAKEIEKVKNALEPWGVQVVVRRESIKGTLGTLPLLKDFSRGSKNQTLKLIQQTFKKFYAMSANVELPDFPQENYNKNASYKQPTADFVIIMDKTL